MMHFIYDLCVYLCLSPFIVGVGFCWPCCEENVCTICTDNWTGIANGTDVSTGTSCGWTEDAGSWSVTSNAVTTGSASAILRSNTLQSSGTAAMKVAASLTSSASNDLVRIIVAYADSTHYHFAEIKIGASGYLKLFIKSGAGAPTELASTTGAVVGASTPTTVTVCISQNLTSIGATVGTFYAHASTSFPASADAFGLGTGGTVTGTVTFDDVVAESTIEGCELCATSQRCTACTGSGANVAELYQADIAGVVHGTGGTNCNDAECNVKNGSFIFNIGDGFGACFDNNPCLGAIEEPVACVNDVNFGILILEFSSIFATASVNSFDAACTTGQVRFSNAYGGLISCLTFSATSITNVSGANTICDYSAATCALTAL